MDGDQALRATDVALCEFCCRGCQGLMDGSGSMDLGGSTLSPSGTCHVLLQLLGTEQEGQAVLKELSF